MKGKKRAKHMPDLSYRMLFIDGAPAGLLGLNELFEELYEAGCRPDDSDAGERLIKGVRQHNFIPKPALYAYREVLLGEYRRYLQERSGDEDKAIRDYGTWEGHPREQIPWFPTVSAELCDGCGNCLEVCPKDVFEKTDDGKVAVMEPFLCIVGCCFCKSACDPEAILMPQKEMLDSFRHGQRQAR
ncbi:MAG: 4Fe-4S dicluster domain-containing protein [Brevefilum sp.]